MDQLLYWRPILTPITNAYGVDLLLVEATIWVESRGRADAFRHEPQFWLRYLAKKQEWKGSNPRRVSSSYGLMQIMYPVAVELGYTGEPEGLFLPKENLHWGCRKIRELHLWAAKYTQVPQAARTRAAIAAYNGGRGGNTPGTTLRNQQYVLKVLAAMNEIRDMDAQRSRVMVT